MFNNMFVEPAYRLSVRFHGTEFVSPSALASGHHWCWLSGTIVWIQLRLPTTQEPHVFDSVDCFSRLAPVAPACRGSGRLS